MTTQSIFITGAASGIGRATALYFHARGWFVGAVDVDAAGLATLSADLEGDCYTSLLDVRDKAAFGTVMKAFAEAAKNRLDLLFNNAGIAVFGFFDEVPFEKTLDVVDINLVGVLNGIHAAWPLLKQTDNSLCFSTASSAASFGSPNLAVYGATKAAIKGLTEAMSIELARYGSRAADVSPGIIDTRLWTETGVRYVKGAEQAPRNRPELNRHRADAARTLSADAVAACVWDAYHSDKLHWYVPEEVEDRVKTSASDPEKMRDQLLAMQDS